MLIFRQLLDSQSFTYTYLLGDSTSKTAVIIDPVFHHARRDIALIQELGLHLLSILDTHVHADHVSGAWLLQREWGARIVISKDSEAECADDYVIHGDRIVFGDRYLSVRATPGHTNGCLTYVMDDESMAFTGDCLLIRGCGRTDFQQGNPHSMYHSVHTQIFTLPAHCLLYPGHDYRGLTVTSVAEEKRFNPRLGGQITEEDFVGYMRHLYLPHPKHIEEALPANQKCGRPHQKEVPSLLSTSLPCTYTFAGVWEIEPDALADFSGKVQLIDVREIDEREDSILGSISGSQLIPLSQLTQRLGELATDIPVVTVCRSGARSSRAAVILQSEGFTNVANLAGGLIRWINEGYPIER